MKMKKILLLSPPGKKMYIRDYYCSKVSKACYINAPIDFVILSGILNKNFSVSLIDAIVEKIDTDKCLQRIRSINPDAMIILVGSVSWEEDLRFIAKIKQIVDCKLILVGDLLLSKAKEKMKENGFIDCVIMDFTDNSIVRYLDNDFRNITGLVYRKGKKIIEKSRNNCPSFSAGVPKHELFIKLRYKLPFVRKYPFATTITNYGCPYRCSFCIMNRFQYKTRKLKEIFSEFRYLNNLKVKTIFFLDQTFGLDKKRTLNICDELKKFDFEWFCFSRVDILDYQLLRAMKEAGCILIMLGVESGNDFILKKYKKEYTKDQVRKTFKLCKRVGIETLGTFLIGLPSENKQTCLETIKFSKELDPDFASFNFAVPRFNTPIRDEAIKKGLIKKNFESMDQAGTFISMPTSSLARDDIKKLRKKAIIGFYMRPSYIIKRISRIRSITQLKEYFDNLVLIIKNL